MRTRSDWRCGVTGKTIGNCRVDYQTEDEMSRNPRTGELPVTGWKSIYPKSTLEPLESQFDLPAQAIGLGHLLGGHVGRSY